VLTETLKTLKKASRKIYKQMPRGGRHGTKKGKKGEIPRKRKHKKGEEE